ncbi:MAG TPA: enoyl-CoA hydratase/isomerase family protein [Sphingomonadaceae bacterium]|nr:enoyl-CoA hydratase/isomerase family protein [Sphingomonadaceae bacterium]
MSDWVHHHRHGAVGHLSLNRPKALHALNLEMVEAMTHALLEWRSDPEIELVLLDHAQGRGFCAGGDVADVRRSVLEDGGAAGRAFFHAEYRLNHLLFTYPKPVACFMDGVTMGGGVGIALPCRYRVATGDTLFAMPEAAIGLFPDVGAGWYLARLPGRLGPFLALTGARLDGAECLWAGLATHYLPSGMLAEAKAQIIADPASIETILDNMSEISPVPRLATNADRINHLFASDQFEDILSSLASDASDWALKELRTLQTKSPLTCKVALRQIAEAHSITDFAEEMRIEYRLASRMIMEPDFAEGVRAVLVDKDNAPHWNPAMPEGISEAKLDALFAPLPPDQEWTPL